MTRLCTQATLFHCLALLCHFLAYTSHVVDCVQRLEKAQRLLAEEPGEAEMMGTDLRLPGGAALVKLTQAGQRLTLLPGQVHSFEGFQGLAQILFGSLPSFLREIHTTARTQGNSQRLART